MSPFDRSREDVGNIVHLEHVNLTIPDPLLATRFYVTGLGLTRDPYLVTGVENMWINVGRTQFHLPHGRPQRLRGTVRIVMPDRAGLVERLRTIAASLRDTRFSFDDSPADHVAVTCPWGNRLQCFEPDARRFGPTRLGIVEVAIDVEPGSAEGIGRFYREIVGARVGVSAGVARVITGPGQQLVFQETSAPAIAYDGHHIQIYVADFSGPHARLLERGLVSEESSQHQYRFVDIVDPLSGKRCCQLEHEVRSLTHPLCGRPLINRNPSQSNRDYTPGGDAFAP